MKRTSFFTLFLTLFLFSACSQYKVDVNLTPEQKASLETNIKSYQAIIEAHDTSDGTIAWAEIIDVANAYIDLGELGKAIKVYENVLKNGVGTKAIINNLGRLYEKVDRYDDAIIMYQRIIDDYLDYDYLRDITWAYIHAGKRHEAEQYFNQWQLAKKTTDLEIQEAIKQLREAENQPME